MTTLATLINKTDTFEILRDRLAYLLAQETANQQTLALQEGENPEDYRLRVFIERLLPWQDWIDFDSEQSDRAPIINVCFDTDRIDLAGSKLAESQKYVGRFNIDCYGVGVATQRPDEGYDPGDKGAALAAQRAGRLVRNILMASENTYLQLPRGTVWRRYVEGRTMFQPKVGELSVQHVSGVRIQLVIDYSEKSVQLIPETLDYLGTTIFRTDDDEIYAEVDFDYTTT